MKDYFYKESTPVTLKCVLLTLRVYSKIINSIYDKLIKTHLNIYKNRKRKNRKLEIGPGTQRIPNFETMNVVGGKNVDYVIDASKKLPFEDGSFQIIYASHILEHIAWYDVKSTLAEWIRLLENGGSLEIWVPDGYKLSKFLCDIEEGKCRVEWKDGWRPRNLEEDPYKWVNGRILYGLKLNYPSWHVAILTPKYLEKLMTDLGLVNIERLSTNDVRGVDHGWINLGMRGYKP